MAAHRKRAAELGLSAISVEGALIAPAEIARIIAAPADQKTANDYGCPKGTTLKDEIARYFRIGQAHWQAFARIEQPTIQQVAEFVRLQLEEVFGFEQLQGPTDHEHDGHRYRIAWEAKGGRVPIVCAAPIADDDAFRRPLPEFGDGPSGPLTRRTPAGLLQEWLNAKPEFLWGLVFAGDRLRLMRDNMSFTRPAWIEADLGAIYRDENFSEFTALWLLIHASRFGGEGAAPGDRALERWREAGLRAGTAVRERLRGSVEEALELLGQGFLDANPDLRERLGNGELQVSAWFEQLLRLVYRLIFLAVAEDRDLLHAPNAKPDAKTLYADNYSFAWLRDRSTRQSGRERHQDAYEGTKIVFRSLVSGEPLLGLPPLGGLFAADLTPDLDNAKLENRSFLAAVFRLAWLMGPHGRERINWRDMATEEFGSVYEGLLELVPVIESGDTFGFAGGAEAKGNARKISGSYYTPDSLVQTLLDSALDPVVERAEAEGGADAILDLKVIDPACGSGHFLLGAARRMANRVATLRDPDAPDYQAAMRDVVRNCIYGVDRNPLAVELAKVALWIEAIEPGKPLGFLDANIRCGDSLLGIFNLKALEEGIPDDAYKPLTGDDKPTANGLKKLNKLEREAKLLRFAIASDKLADRFEQLHEMPESTPDEIRAKERAYRRLRGDPDWLTLRQACDAYVAAFLLSKEKPEGSFTAPLVPTTRHVREALDRRPPKGALAEVISDVAREARVFHWPVEFPDMIMHRGGFDVVLGNPPWERIKLQEQEFFAQRAPEIATAPNAAARGAMIKALSDAPRGSSERQLHDSFRLAKRIAAASSLFFTAPKDQDPVKGATPSAGRRYPWTGRGDINTYALFAEHFSNLTNERGHAGVIVPTGIATDATTAPFFGHLVSDRRLAAVIDFENREGIFPSVDSRLKFCLLTISSGVTAADFAFFLTDVAHNQDERRHFTLEPEDVSRINPNTKTAPVFRSKADAELTAKIYRRVPTFEEGWHPTFLKKMFDFDIHKELLEFTREQPSEDHLPLYEAKMITFFNHRASTYEGVSEEDVLNGKARYSTELELSDPLWEPTVRCWTRKENFRARMNGRSWDKNWFVSMRDKTNATNERTAIFAFRPYLPSNDTAPSVFISANTMKVVGAVSNLSSLIVDFVARQKVGGLNLAAFIVEQLPVLPPHSYGEADISFLASRALELSYTSWSMQPLATDLGCNSPPFGWDEDRRAQLRAELDAWYALAYGLSRDELRYILDPKDVMGADYPSETFRVLQKNEVAKYGEYLTRRLVLAAYDEMVAEGARPRIEGWRQ